jgi:hypothetical protein
LAKYDVNHANEVLEWVRETIQEDFDTNGEMGNFGEQLRDGQKLCKLINKLIPDRIRKINTGTMAFKLMENIEQFTRACKEYGLNDAETFQTVDLWDGENLHQVCVCIQALGRKAQKNGFKGIGPKEADRNERQFTPEQLMESQKIISLQYGTNKCANQSGVVFGNTRHM